MRKGYQVMIDEVELIEKKIDKAVKVRGDRFRIEKAENLLTYWAFSHLTHENHIEIEVGYTSESVINGLNSSQGYKPFCFNLKTNAKSTRPQGQSKIPMGGVTYADTNSSRSRQIDAMFIREFSERARMLLIGLFLPPATYGSGILSDAKICQAFNFKPRRGSQIRVQGVALVVENLLSTPA